MTLTYLLRWGQIDLFLKNAEPHLLIDLVGLGTSILDPSVVKQYKSVGACEG